LFDALRHYAATVKAPLHVPGHKLGQAAPPEWRAYIGDNALAIDLTEAPGLDDLHAPSGPIAEAQALAAEAFGAAESHFLVGGTTAGLHALILTACRSGQTMAVPRHAHRSVIGALILAGVKPAWVRVKFAADLHIATGVDPSSLQDALQEAAAAVLVHPTYYGVAGNLAAEIALIHRAGAAALVDEAHGTHFAFHPDMPPAALTVGADGAAQSVHKTGGSLTQSSLCHLGTGGRLDPVRLKEMLRLVQSTSPSYLLMASLDAARRDLALNGRALWDRALALAHSAREQINQVSGLRVYPASDPTKLLVDVRGRGITGFAAADFLWSRGVAVETCGLDYVLAVFSPGDTPAGVQSFVEAMRDLPQGPGTPQRPPEPPWPEVVLTPREAYLGAKDSVPLAQAVGRIAAELVSPSPPGIPAIVPGERLTADVVAYLQHAVAAGYHLQGPSDPDLHTIRVVRE
jgi:arginine/lysine/ornithine decarboxylase